MRGEAESAYYGDESRAGRAEGAEGKGGDAGPENGEQEGQEIEERQVKKQPQMRRTNYTSGAVLLVRCRLHLRCCIVEKA